MPVKQSKNRRDRLEAAALRQRTYQDVEERRLKEWENYQRSHRADEDQNPNRAFIDITMGDALMGRLVFELFESVVPNTVAHFRALVTGSAGVDPTTGIKRDYLHCPLVNVSAEDRVIVFGQMGRTDAGDNGGELPGENFTQRHNERGLLTMMSRGPHTGDFAFGVTLSPAPAFDFRQVVFGRLVDGAALLDKLEALPVNAMGRPLNPVTVALCGALTGERPPGYWRSPSAAVETEEAEGE